MNLVTILGYLIQDAFWSALAAVGFAILFNAPKRTLPGCAAGAAIGHSTRALLMLFGVSTELGTLIGATVIGFLGLLFARRWHVPAPVFTISAVIPFVPGSLAFRTMLGLLEIANATPNTGETMLLQTATNAIKTAFILGAIAIGIAAPNFVFFRRKPVV
jgi:uncharacterized membrane protein YjjB (DUF3815 family)